MVTKEQIWKAIFEYVVAASGYIGDPGWFSRVVESSTKLRELLDGAFPDADARTTNFVQTDAVEGENPQPITETATRTIDDFAPDCDDTSDLRREVKREYYDELVDLYFARLNAGEDEWTARQTVNDAISFLADLNKDLDC